MSNPMESPFSQFFPEFLDRLQKASDEHLEEFDEHKAFPFLVADLFDTTRADKFILTDGAKDGGIDFITNNAPVYKIWQCKCPDLDMFHSVPVERKFDKAAIQELTTAVRYVIDTEAVYDLKADIQRLRTDFHRDQLDDKENTRLVATLAIMGSLTPAANDLFVAERDRLSEFSVELRLITWSEISKALHRDDSESADAVYLRYNDYEKDVLSRSDYFYMLARAEDFYIAWRQHGWTLFDLNVRLGLYNSPINSRIVASLQSARNRKRFHHLNNGILIVCKNYRNDKSNQRIKLEQPQIINGCQTVTAIRTAYDLLNPREQREFNEQTFVQVKVIMSAADYIDDLIVSTNDQNPMNPRNLRSNTSEQKGIQKQFRELMPEHWFYERKDGEWKSLEQQNSHVKWFKKADYQILGKGRPRFRVVDNLDIAKAWYSWIGFSEAGLQGGIDYFSDSHQVYERVFRSSPTDSFWSDFSQMPSYNPKESHFQPGVPSAHQYLLAYTVGRYIQLARGSSQKSKQFAIQRGLDAGYLEQVPGTTLIKGGDKEVGEFLAQDEEYKIDLIMLNIRETLIELYSLVLARRYGPLSPSTSRSLLQIFDVQEFMSNGLNDISSLSKKRDSDLPLLESIYSFMRYCIKQFYYENKGEINSIIRIKSYFYAKKNMIKLREFIIKNLSGLRDYDAVWKKVGLRFGDSLPAIPTKKLDK